MKIKQVFIYVFIFFTGVIFYKLVYNNDLIEGTGHEETDIQAKEETEVQQAAKMFPTCRTPEECDQDIKTIDVDIKDIEINNNQELQQIKILSSQKQYEIANKEKTKRKLIELQGQLVRMLPQNNAVISPIKKP